MKIALIYLALLLGLPPVPWQYNFEKAKAEATASHKLVLISFGGSDWCAPCIKLTQEVFESKPFVEYATDKLVLVRADFPRLKKNQLPAQQIAHNEALAEKYNPEGKFPFTVVTDASGKVLKQWDGYPKNLSPAAMLQEIKEIRN